MGQTRLATSLHVIILPHVPWTLSGMVREEEPLLCSTWNDVARRECQLLILVEEVANVLVQDQPAHAPHWKDVLWPCLHTKHSCLVHIHSADCAHLQLKYGMACLHSKSQ